MHIKSFDDALSFKLDGFVIFSNTLKEFISQDYQVQVIGLYRCIPMKYSKCLYLQRTLNNLRNEGKIKDLIIATEHEDVYTAGTHFKDQDNSSYGVPIIKVERGGSVTYHGKGQLVLYFILNLKERGINVKQLIELVQVALKSTLNLYGLQAEGRLFKETGVWIGSKKVCSIGFAIKEFSTFHGIGINLNTDISKFSLINPCDFDPGIMTSVSREIGHSVDEHEFLTRLVEKLSDEFKEEIEIKDCRELQI